MARTGRIKKEGDGHYHVMSRTNAKAFLFRSGRMKDGMADLLMRSAAFSGIELDAYAVLDNHFHAAVTVVKPDEPVGEEEILRRIAILKGDRAADAIAGRWRQMREKGEGALVESALDGWRRRMHDVSEFAKTFKELVNIHYKKENLHCGSIWSGRFASTVVEGGKYWSTVRRYIELNAVRARIVGQSKDYAWCSHATTTGERASRYALSDGEIVLAGSVPEDGAVCCVGTCCKGTDPAWGPVGGAVGTDPAWEGALLRRMVWIGAGKIFGGRTFVEELIGRSTRALPRGARARQVLGDAFATHGWRLSKETAAAA